MARTREIKLHVHITGQFMPGLFEPPHDLFLLFSQLGPVIGEGLQLLGVAFAHIRAALDRRLKSVKRLA